MLDQFTDRARRAIVPAREEARLFNHNYVGTEYLLIAACSPVCRRNRNGEASGRTSRRSILPRRSGRWASRSGAPPPRVHQIYVSASSWKVTRPSPGRGWRGAADSGSNGGVRRRSVAGKSVSARRGGAGSPARCRRDDLRSTPHRIGGVVLVAEHVIGLGHTASASRAPAR